MAEVYALKVEVGREAPVSLVTALVNDIETITESAANLATHVASGQADRLLARALRRGGMRGLMEEARRRELPSSHEDDYLDLLEAERALEEFIFGPRPPRLERGLLLGLLPATGRLAWSNLLDELRADELVRLLPREPYQYKSLRYGNPLTAEIIVEVGAAAAALATLLPIIRDWGPRHREANARADDVEDEVQSRIKLRRLLLAKVASGEVPISYDAVDDVISGPLPGAVNRLGQREIDIQKPGDEESDEGDDTSEA